MTDSDSISNPIPISPSLLYSMLGEITTPLGFTFPPPTGIRPINISSSVSSSSSSSSITSPSVSNHNPFAYRDMWPHGILKVELSTHKEATQMWGTDPVPVAPVSMIIESPYELLKDPCMIQIAEQLNNLQILFHFPIRQTPSLIAFVPMGKTDSILHFLESDGSTVIKSIKVLGVYEPMSWRKWNVLAYQVPESDTCIVILRVPKFYPWPIDRFDSASFITDTKRSLVSVSPAVSTPLICTFIVLTHEGDAYQYVKVLEVIIEELSKGSDLSQLRVKVTEALQLPKSLIENWKELDQLYYHLLSTVRSQLLKQNAAEILKRFEFKKCDPHELSKLKWNPSHMVMFISHAFLNSGMLAGIPQGGNPSTNPTLTNEKIGINSEHLLQMMKVMCQPGLTPVQVMIFTGCEFAHSNFLQKDVAPNYPQIRIISYYNKVAEKLNDVANIHPASHAVAIAIYLSLYFLGDTATMKDVLNWSNTQGIVSPIHGVFSWLRSHIQPPFQDTDHVELFNPEGIYANFDGQAQFLADLLGHDMQTKTVQERHEFLCRSYKNLKVGHAKLQQNGGDSFQLITNGEVQSLQWDKITVSFTQPYRNKPLNRTTHKQPSDDSLQ